MVIVGETLDYSTVPGALHAFAVAVRQQKNNFAINADSAVAGLLAVSNQIATKLSGDCTDAERKELAGKLRSACRALELLREAERSLDAAEFCVQDLDPASTAAGEDAGPPAAPLPRRQTGTGGA